MQKRKKRINKSATLWALGKVKHRILGIAFITGLSIVSGSLGVAFALGTEAVIDSAMQGELSALLWASVRLGCLILAMIGCSILSRHSRDKLSADLERDLKKQMMHLLLHGEYEGLSHYHSGDLVHRLNVDVLTIINTILNAFPSMASLAVRTGAVIGVLWGTSPVFTLVLLGLCMLVGGGGFFLRKTLKRLDKQIKEASGHLSGFLQEVVSNLLIVQALDVAASIEEQEETLLENRWQLQKRRKNIGILTSTGLSFLGYLVGFVTLVWCAYRMMHGQMTFGALTATTQLAEQLEAPAYALPGLLRSLISMSASAERLMELEDIPQVKESAQLDAAELYRDMEAITARDLSFGYDRSLVLEKVNFTIPKNKLTVILGPSGIGKSTLLKLLLGIYAPVDGELSITGTKETVSVSRDTRGLFSYTPQGNLLLSGTLRENLTFACPHADEEAIRRAVYVSGMDEYVAQLPEGLDTYLGEKASGLSEGQAQRLSLARAILKGSPILLLDEVTSALDGETERKVLGRIRAMGNVTCIVVTHRPAVLELADWQLTVTEAGVDCGPVQRSKQQETEVTE